MKKLLSIFCVLVLIAALLCGCIAEELPEEISRPETTTTAAQTTFSTVAPPTTVSQTVAETTAVTTQDTTTGVTAAPSTATVTATTVRPTTVTKTRTQSATGGTVTTLSTQGPYEEERGDYLVENLGYAKQIEPLKYTGTATEVQVPLTLEGYFVVGFSFHVYEGSSVETVYVPEYPEDGTYYRFRFNDQSRRPRDKTLSTFYLPRSIDKYMFEGVFGSRMFWSPGGAPEQHVYLPKTVTFDCSYVEKYSSHITEEGDTVTYHISGSYNAAGEEMYAPTTFTLHYYE